MRKQYATLVREAKRQGWGRWYKGDLTQHDCLALKRRDNPQQFVWVLREKGTHLYFRSDWLESQNYQEYVAGSMNHLANCRSLSLGVYIYDYGRFFLATFEQAMLFLATGFTGKIGVLL